MKPDVRVEDHGSIVLLRPITRAGRNWLEADLPDDAPTFGGAFVCEPRYVADIVDGMIADGLVVA